MSENLGARLCTAKESLAAWYELLNSQWADAEETLRSFNLSRNVWACFKRETIEYDREQNLSRDWDFFLIFMKHDGEWRICYAVGEAGDDPDSFTTRPILDCSLEDRGLALEGLPKLLESIVEEAESESASLEAALGAAAESLASFKAVK